MDVSQLKPKTATIRAALAYFLFSKKRFIQLAVEHDFALDLQSADLKKKCDAKEWPTQPEVDNWFSRFSEQLRDLRKEFWGSGLMTLSIAIAAGGLASLLGTSMPDVWEPKHLAAIGGLLAAWGTIFQLAHVPKSWSGETMFEIIRPPLFLLLFVPGSIMAISGTLA